MVPGLWLALRRWQFSTAALRLGDVCFGTVISLLAAAGVFIATRPAELYIHVAVLGFCLLARALYVPSSVRRTLVLCICWALPTYAVAIAVAIVFPDRFALPTFSWLANLFFLIGLPVFLATFGSFIISGLREEVRDAKKLGQYTLGEQIGAGGMGTVYRAQHRLLRRPTAVNLLRPGSAGAAAIDRFEREVQLTAALTDPHTVAIFDYGRSTDGTFYYAMEYLDGIDLESLVREWGPQPCQRVTHILRQVCQSLAEAHEHGLVHRDIKPANIMLCERGLRSDVVKVVDFGLVRDLQDESQAADLAGTPRYLSPESVLDPESVGPASDLYSLGAVGYFLASGLNVFDGQTVPELYEQHASVAPTPPSARGVDIEPALETLLLSCLAKSPADRPSSAMEFYQALGDISGTDLWNEEKRKEWWTAYRACKQELVEIGADETLVDPNPRTPAKP